MSALYTKVRGVIMLTWCHFAGAASGCPMSSDDDDDIIIISSVPYRPKKRPMLSDPTAALPAQPVVEVRVPPAYAPSVPAPAAFPEWWDGSRASPCLVDVSAGSAEYDFVMSKFHVHGYAQPVSRVQRVQVLSWTSTAVVPARDVVRVLDNPEACVAALVVLCVDRMTFFG